MIQTAPHNLIYPYVTSKHDPSRRRSRRLRERSGRQLRNWHKGGVNKRRRIRHQRTMEMLEKEGDGASERES